MMRKITLMLAVVFSVAVANSFAADKTDKDKGMKCSTPGKSCCKKEAKASANEKAKTAKDKKAA